MGGVPHQLQEEAARPGRKDYVNVQSSLNNFMCFFCDAEFLITCLVYLYLNYHVFFNLFYPFLLVFLSMYLCPLYIYLFVCLSTFCLFSVNLFVGMMDIKTFLRAEELVNLNLEISRVARKERNLDLSSRHLLQVTKQD